MPGGATRTTLYAVTGNNSVTKSALEVAIPTTAIGPASPLPPPQMFPRAARRTPNLQSLPNAYKQSSPTEAK